MSFFVGKYIVCQDIFLVILRQEFIKAHFSWWCNYLRESDDYFLGAYGNDQNFVIRLLNRSLEYILGYFELNVSVSFFFRSCLEAAFDTKIPVFGEILRNITKKKFEGYGVSRKIQKGEMPD